MHTYLLLSKSNPIVQSYLVQSKSNFSFCFQSEESRERFLSGFLSRKRRNWSHRLSLINKNKQIKEWIIFWERWQKWNCFKDKRVKYVIYSQNLSLTTKSGHFSSMPSENGKIGYPIVGGIFRALTTHSKISPFVDIGIKFCLKGPSI